MLPLGSLSKTSLELRGNSLSTYFLCSILLKLSTQTDPPGRASTRFVLFDYYDILISISLNLGQRVAPF